MHTLFAHSEVQHNPFLRYKRRDNSIPSVNIRNMKLNIRQIRKAKKFTQDDLAKIAGVSPSYLSEIETGRKPINSARLQKIADALGVSPTALISDDDATTELEQLTELMGQLDLEGQRQVMEFARFRVSSGAKSSE